MKTAHRKKVVKKQTRIEIPFAVVVTYEFLNLIPVTIPIVTRVKINDIVFYLQATDNVSIPIMVSVSPESKSKYRPVTVGLDKGFNSHKVDWEFCPGDHIRLNCLSSIPSGASVVFSFKKTLTIKGEGESDES